MFNDNYKTLYWLLYQFKGGKKGGIKWTTFSHNGVLFSPKYEPHRVPLLYNGERIVLPEVAEEYATLYAKYSDSEYVKNKIFNKNFWNDWKKILKQNGVNNIDSLENCDFHLIFEHLVKQKEKRMLVDSETKKRDRENRKKNEEKYSIAIVDGKQQPVGNYRVEPPSIFIGRGCHPLLGKIKRRIFPEDITLNLSKDAQIPAVSDGHKWGSIIHDRHVEWIASWHDNITGKIKYVWLGQHSELRNKSDLEKFDRARKLRKKIKEIRSENEKNMQSENIKMKQIATALYFIDKFALRVGNEKSEDQADTVGVTSLRVEHITLLDNNVIKLDFLGKDSIRYNNKVTVDEIVFKNIEQFCFGKNKTDFVFDQIIPNDLNKYLQSFMKDLTSKVFRTFNASYLFYKEIKKINAKMEKYDNADKINVLLDLFNKANAKVAVLCNHQKNVSKSFNKQLDNINEMIDKLKEKRKKTKNKKSVDAKLKSLKAKKEIKIELKNISLSTSKVNYIDPRITIAFMKKHKIPIDKLFTTVLQQKFKWAFEIDENWKY